MSDALRDLEPRSVWQAFAALAAIPRPSKHEKRVADWIRGLAAERGWETRADATGNLVVVVPASPGRERAPVVVLQSHLDMVCEKDDGTEHDFLNDPIRPRIDGEWVRASGTTLGADNGIGVSAALAVATEPGLVHGPLELLFTVDEETGLTGAGRLDPTLVRGRTLINLDSEDDATIFVGCAGGATAHLFLEPAWHEVPDLPASAIRVRGLRGGHSGINIHESRGNALKLLDHVLLAALDAGIDLDLAALRGGTAHNAIPREAVAIVMYQDRSRLEALAAVELESRRGAFAGIDEGLEIDVAPADPPERVMQRADRDRLLDLLAVLPHGVLGMSRSLPGLVETSANLAIVDESDDRIRIVCSARSSLAPAQRAVLRAVRSAAHLAVSEIQVHDGYPGWAPDLDSRVLGVTRRVLHEVWGREPEVTAVHAGLECGLLGQKLPGIDMVSFGPRIEGAHSPAERVRIASVGRFFTALAKLLDELSNEKAQA